MRASVRTCSRGGGGQDVCAHGMPLQHTPSKGSDIEQGGWGMPGLQQPKRRETKPAQLCVCARVSVRARLYARVRGCAPGLQQPKQGQDVHTRVCICSCACGGAGGWLRWLCCVCAHATQIDLSCNSPKKLDTCYRRTEKTAFLWSQTCGYLGLGCNSPVKNESVLPAAAPQPPCPAAAPLRWAGRVLGKPPCHLSSKAVTQSVLFGHSFFEFREQGW